MVTDRYAITIMGGNWFAQHARPSDAGLPYAPNVDAAVSIFRAGANRLQIDADKEMARGIKHKLSELGEIR